MKKEIRVVFALVCALVILTGVQAQAQESEAFKEYGQEFKGKIAKSPSCAF